MNPLTLKDAKIDGAKVKVGIVERSTTTRPVGCVCTDPADHMEIGCSVEPGLEAEAAEARQATDYFDLHGHYEGVEDIDCSLCGEG